MNCRNSLIAWVLCGLVIVAMTAIAYYEYKTKIENIDRLTRQNEALKSALNTSAETILLDGHRAPLPSFSLWKSIGKTVKLQVKENENGKQLWVEGDDSPYLYQAISPSFPVLPNVRVRI